MKFTFHYTKQIEAKDIVTAVNKAKRTKAKLRNIETHEEIIKYKEPCIGFDIEEDEWEDE